MHLKSTSAIQENAHKNEFENAVCKLLAIMSQTQSVNSSPPSAAYKHQCIGSALVQIMACHPFGAKPLSKPVLSHCQLDP